MDFLRGVGVGVLYLWEKAAEPDEAQALGNRCRAAPRRDRGSDAAIDGLLAPSAR